MNYEAGKLLNIFFLIAILFLTTCHSGAHYNKGSCEFDDAKLCDYTLTSTDGELEWKLKELEEYMTCEVIISNSTNTDTVTKITSPLISLKSGHCVTYKYRIAPSQTDKSSDPIQPGVVSHAELSVYVEDSSFDKGNFPHRVWSTSSLTGSKWKKVQLSMGPSSYRLAFGVERRAGGGGGGQIDINVDSVRVENSMCDENGKRFLRLADSYVNRPSDNTTSTTPIKCSLYDGSSPRSRDHNATSVTLQLASDDDNVATTLGSDRSSTEEDDHVFDYFGGGGEEGRLRDGVYRCLYSSPLHVALSNPARYHVSVPPVPEMAPTADNIGPTNIALRLNSLLFRGDGPIIGKQLHYRRSSQTWKESHQLTSDGDDDTYEVWHLTPDTSYIFSLQLERPGVGGRGEEGPESVLTTACMSPTARVTTISVLPTPLHDPHTLVVTWQPLPFSVVNCHTYEYTVEYRPLLAQNQQQAEFQEIFVGKENTTTIKSLRPYTKYEVCVWLYNNAGSKKSKPVIATTPQSVPGPIPADSFKVSLRNESTVTLVWRKPKEENGVLLNYQITYQATSSFDPTFRVENENAHIEHKFPDRRLALDGLRAGTNFTISICAVTSVGNGPLTTLHNISTEIAPPIMAEEILPVNESRVTPTTVEVNLAPAHSNGAPVTNYYLVIEDITDQVSDDYDGGGGGGNYAIVRGKRDVGANHTEPHDEAVVNAEDDDDGSSKPSCRGMNELLDYASAKKKNSTMFVAAELTPDQLQQERVFVVGDGKKVGGFSNIPLDPNRKYRIYLRADSKVGQTVKSDCKLLYEKEKQDPPPPPPGNERMETPIGQEEGGTDMMILYGSIGGAVLAAIIIVVFAAVLIARRRRKKSPQKDEVVNPFEVRLMLSDMSPSNQQQQQHAYPTNTSSTATNHQQPSYMSDLINYHHNEPDFSEKTPGGVGGDCTGASSVPDGVGGGSDEKFAIRVDDFHLHVSQMKSADGYGFREEFALFPDGPTAAWNVAQASINKKKNRYNNIMAYDHSRVVLQPFCSGSSSSRDSSDYNLSDYINASYVQGYKRPAMYIATQAPSADTCGDFWTMVWQERCSVLVMLTNLMELGKRKCHKYWNDERQQYGNIEVSTTNEEFTSDYVVRTFLLRDMSGYDVREVRQFHFSAWPDHGVPSRPTSLLTFVRRIKAYEPPDGPTIVHCSAGSGRTGCYITIDQMLDMAREEEIVDVYNTVRELRSRRVDMVQTEEQYVFIHEAILEALICGETSVVPDQLGAHYDEIITVDVVSSMAPIQDEFETLNLITPRLGDEECSIARLPRNRSYNRFKDVLPADRHLAYLLSPDPTDRNNSYINAVFVDSYSRRNAFLVTQMPLPSTVVDMWRLIYDHQCTSIVMMNHHSEHDQTCALYWPEKGSETYGQFEVELVAQEDEIDVVTRVFKLQNISNPNEGVRYLKQFQLTNWPGPQPVPYSRNAVLRVIQLNMKWKGECERSGNHGRTVVHCVAGAGRSGTFVACHNMCEQMSCEYSADVFNNVQRLRNVRPHLVETLEQYRFCYEVGIEFADQ